MSKVTESALQANCPEAVSGFSTNEELFFNESGKRRRGIQLNCLNCDKQFIGRVKNPKKYCSIPCANKHRHIASKKIYVECFVCKINVLRKPSNLSNSKSGLYFCSRKCKELAQTIKFGCKEIQPKHYGTTLKNHRQIAKRFKEKICERCGFNDIVEILHVHHIDGDHGNNELSNLKILCPNCHAIEHYIKRLVMSVFNEVITNENE